MRRLAAESDTEASHVTAIGQVVADGSIGGYLKRVKVRERADARPHANLLGKHRGFANKKLGARKLIRRVIADKSSVLTDPSFLQA